MLYHPCEYKSRFTCTEPKGRRLEAVVCINQLLDEQRWYMYNKFISSWSRTCTYLAAYVQTCQVKLFMLANEVWHCDAHSGAGLLIDSQSPWTNTAQTWHLVVARLNQLSSAWSVDGLSPFTNCEVDVSDLCEADQGELPQHIHNTTASTQLLQDLRGGHWWPLRGGRWLACHSTFTNTTASTQLQRGIQLS